jgi:DNA-binding transcriptional regulator YiaG
MSKLQSAKDSRSAGRVQDLPGNPAAILKMLLKGVRRNVRPVDVAAIRALTGLSQAKFARACRISVHTLRNWEQGRRLPHGPARALLLVIAREPKTVMRALRGA